MENVSHNTSFSANEDDEGDADNRDSSLRRSLHDFWNDNENVSSTPMEAQTTIKKSPLKGKDAQDAWTLGSNTSRQERGSVDSKQRPTEAKADNFFTLNQVQEHDQAARHRGQPKDHSQDRATFGTVMMHPGRDHCQMQGDAKVHTSQFQNTLKSSHLGFSDSENMDQVNSTFDRGQFVQREAKLISKVSKGKSQQITGLVLQSNKKLMQRQSLPTGGIPIRVSAAHNEFADSETQFMANQTKALHLALQESTLTSVVRDELKMTHGSSIGLQSHLGNTTSYRISRKGGGATSRDNSAQGLRNLLSRQQMDDVQPVFSGINLQENESEAESNMIQSSDEDEPKATSRLQSSSEVMSANYIDPESKNRLSYSFPMLGENNRQPSQKSIQESSSGGVGKRKKTPADHVQFLSQIGKLESGQHIHSIMNTFSRGTGEKAPNNNSMMQVYEITKEIEIAQKRRKSPNKQNQAQLQNKKRELIERYFRGFQQLQKVHETRQMQNLIKKLTLRQIKAKQNQSPNEVIEQGCQTQSILDHGHVTDMLSQQHQELGQNVSFKSLGANQYSFQQDQVTFLLTQLQELPQSFSAARCKIICTELSKLLSQMSKHKIQVEQLKAQSLERVELLSKIEMSLFEREIEVDNKMTIIKNREKQIQFNIGFGKMEQKTTETQTDMSYFENVIRREAELVWRESRAQIKAEKFEELLRQHNGRKVQLEREFAQKKDLLISQGLELEKREQLITERFKNDLQNPLNQIRTLDKNIAEHIQILDKAKEADNNTDENTAVDNFMKEPSSQQFLDKMTELVKAYTSNGYVSEEQYELVLFKKARAILTIEYEVSRKKTMAENIITELVKQQRILNRESRDRVNNAHIAYQTDDMLALARKETAIAEQKKQEIQLMIDMYDQKHQEVLDTLKTEGYNIEISDEKIAKLKEAKLEQQRSGKLQKNTSKESKLSQDLKQSLRDARSNEQQKMNTSRDNLNQSNGDIGSPRSRFDEMQIGGLKSLAKPKQLKTAESLIKEYQQFFKQADMQDEIGRNQQMNMELIMGMQNKGTAAQPHSLSRKQSFGMATANSKIEHSGGKHYRSQKHVMEDSNNSQQASRFNYNQYEPMMKGGTTNWIDHIFQQ